MKFFKDNGARFIMPVACHHDNFDMYDSFHPWNAVDMGPKRDTLKEWKAAAAKHGLKWGSPRTSTGHHAFSIPHGLRQSLELLP